MYVCGPTPELSSTFSMNSSVSGSFSQDGCRRAPSIHFAKSVFRLRPRARRARQSSAGPALSRHSRKRGDSASVQLGVSLTSAPVRKPSLTSLSQRAPVC